jgi:hypothetical protein
MAALVCKFFFFSPPLHTDVHCACIHILCVFKGLTVEWILPKWQKSDSQLLLLIFLLHNVSYCNLFLAQGSARYAKRKKNSINLIAMIIFPENSKAAPAEYDNYCA